MLMIATVTINLSKKEPFYRCLVIHVNGMGIDLSYKIDRIGRVNLYSVRTYVTYVIFRPKLIELKEKE